MKQCIECKEYKPLTSFYKKTTSHTTQHYMSWCKPCHSARRSNRTSENKLRAIEYMGGRCQQCGYDRCAQALEFHHIDPELKTSNFTNLKCWGWDKLQAELDKCVMLCANCHREVENGLVMAANPANRWAIGPYESVTTGCTTESPLEKLVQSCYNG